MKRWENLDIPEYDFDTNELVYRTKNGREIRREAFELETPYQRLYPLQAQAPELAIQSGSSPDYDMSPIF